MKTRKPLSILLTVCMLVGLLPWSALPARADDLPGWATGAGITADDATWDGSTLTLTKDVDTTAEIVIDSAVTIDLNGHIIDRGLTSEVASGGVITVKSGASLTLNDGNSDAAHDPELTWTDPVTNETTAVTGGVITGGRKEFSGGGVYVDGGEFTMNGGAILGNKATQSGGGVFVHNCVDLYGVVVTTGKLTMNGGAILGNKAKEFEGGGVYIDGGEFAMHGGAISGNAACGYGGGVGVYGFRGASTFTIDGGTISGNTAEQCGGGVFISNKNAAMTMSGSAAITGNRSDSKGGGVYLYDQATFTMDGGTISGNSTGEKGYGGGGVYINESSTFTMNGGAIRGNMSHYYCGGVFVYDGCKFNVSGSPVVQDNYVNGEWDAESGMYVQGSNGTVLNVMVNPGTKKINTFVTVTGALDDEARIGVMPGKYNAATGLYTPVTTAFTKSLEGNGTAANFTSDLKNYVVRPTSDGTQAHLVKGVVVTFVDDGETLYTQTLASGETAEKPADPAKTGWTFMGWQLNGKTFDFSEPVSKSVTLTAAWEFVPALAADGAVTAPEGALLILAAYDTRGRLCTLQTKTVDTRCVNAELSTFGLSLPESGNWMLMLVDGTTFAPLCAAQSSPKT